MHSKSFLTNWQPLKYMLLPVIKIIPMVTNKNNKKTLRLLCHLPNDIINLSRYNMGLFLADFYDTSLWKEIKQCFTSATLSRTSFRKVSLPVSLKSHLKVHYFLFLGFYCFFDCWWTINTPKQTNSNFNSPPSPMLTMMTQNIS